jgi:hypothetical protein
MIFPLVFHHSNGKSIFFYRIFPLKHTKPPLIEDVPATPRPLATSKPEAISPNFGR